MRTVAQWIVRREGLYNMLPFGLTGAVMADYTRCILAVIVYGTTAAAILFRVPLPGEWWIVVAAASGFYFGMEVPRYLLRTTAAFAAAAVVHEAERAAGVVKATAAETAAELRDGGEEPKPGGG